MKCRLFKGRNPFGMLSEWESKMRSRNTPAEITGYYIGPEHHALWVFYEADDEDQPSQPQRPANE